LAFKYVAVGTDDLEAAVTAFKSLAFRGFGVSMPFKVEIIKYVDEVTDDVRLIGACNTVVQNNGKLTAYNTDWQGAISALEEVGAGQPATAVVVGAGGVARAIAFGLKKKGWKVCVCARDKGKAGVLVSELGLVGTLDLAKQGDCGAHLIVNATPAAEAHGGPLDVGKHPSARYMLDVVFSPKETNLAAFGRQKGLRVAPGWRMLLHQALHQFQLYTGHAPPQAPMSSVLEKALG
jgi:shikimate dehydrogenase